ncbi:protein PTST homolog 2, chloroplastic-like isoform X2 [Neltuma alba]|uniref:protein PTST homolog 2, chloroplastic-like isoform X2 n=1 Tax=Neltuma alba TaxID=207710 RepID=UPI0010A45D6D|nr:protein PTST homolog 2, chloroplastic-like isoform X2 [Prosopis alba]
MHSLTASAYLLLPHKSFAGLNSLHFPSIFFVVDSRGRRRAMQFATLNLVKETGSLLGCSDSFKKGNCHKGLYWGYSGFLRRCKDWDCEGDFSLEAEILEFMKNSKNPTAFPTKKQLIDAGRMDLVDAIIKKGGWLAFGWDLGEEAEEVSGEVHVKHENLLIKNECDVKQESNKIEGAEIWGSGRVFRPVTYSQTAVSPDRSVEIAEQSGIEGILNRLEKERNGILGLGFRPKEDNVSSSGQSEDKDESHHRSTINSVAADLDKSAKPARRSSNGSPHGGFPSKLDAEIAPSGTGLGAGVDVSGNDVFETRQLAATPINREADSSPPGGKANYKEIKSRIQQLESELSSVLQSLRSGVDEVGIQTGPESSSDDLHKLSDAWEFQENEILRAKDRLRSIRAKLAVLEGKMTLAIMDADKIIEEKQKKIDNACRALRFLKTTCVVWPNAASEVLLAGSFDGWSSKRKMEKSNSGVFSAYLQLYPGKYEIKFIVDGEWKIDPLRPVVHNNGYENNLLIIQE